MEAIHYELNKLTRDGLTPDELAMGKEQVKSTYIFGLENINARMLALGKNKLLNDRINDPDEILKIYDSITEEDIERVAAKIGDPGNYCGAAVTGKDFDLKAIAGRKA